MMSSEFQYTLSGIDNTSVLLALSQSGETADVLQAVNAAKAYGSQSTFYCECSDFVIGQNQRFIFD